MSLYRQILCVFFLIRYTIWNHTLSFHTYNNNKKVLNFFLYLIFFFFFSFHVCFDSLSLLFSDSRIHVLDYEFFHSICIRIDELNPIFFPGVYFSLYYYYPYSSLLLHLGASSLCLCVSFSLSFLLLSHFIFSLIREKKRCIARKNSLKPIFV